MSRHVLQDVAWVAAQTALVASGEPLRVHSPLFSRHGIDHAFLGRDGNRGEFQYVKQVHGTELVAAGASTAVDVAVRARADGVFTTQHGYRVAVKTADCVPILCCDREAQRIALAVHAGRRGLLAGIVARAVACLAEQGVGQGELLWAIGPAISMAAYEVSPTEMEAVYGEAAGLRGEQAAWCLGKGHDDRWHIDLQLLAVLQLLNCGVGAAQIEVIRICTYVTAELFYSFRYDKQHRGSNWSYVALA